MQAVLERRGDAEVAAAAAQRPEEVGIGVGGHVDDAAVGGHELDAEHVVGREPVLRHQPAEAAAERQARDAGRGDRAARDGEPVRCRLAVQLAPEHAALRAHRARSRIDPDALHRRQVDHQRVVGDRAAGDVVPASAYADVEAVCAREADRVDDVGGVLAARDQRRPPVDEPVVDASCALVSVGLRLVQDAGETGAELFEALA